MLKYKILFLAFLSAFTNLTAYSQKLPNVQEKSLALPADFKIDGKLSELNELQSYNRSTDIYYSMANDKEKLYLVIQARNTTTIKKILGGGLTLLVNPFSDKGNEKGLKLTYPVLPFKIQSKLGMDLGEITLAKAANTRKSALDSIAQNMNDSLKVGLKTIGVAGLSEISDSQLSIYNRQGIRVAGSFDTNGYLTCELLLPIKLVAHLGVAEHGLTYNIMLNGLSSVYKSHAATTSSGEKVTVTGIPSGLFSQGNLQTMKFPTDFWGSYTLAK